MNLPMNPQRSAPATAERPRLKFDLMDPAAFDHINRLANVYANSDLFPDHLRKGGQNKAIANAILCMNIAERLREDPLTVAQNIYFVGGKPGWSASYMISKANQHGVFKDPIDFEAKGEGEDLSVTAFGVLTSTKKKVAVTVSMKTAKLEGWTRNSKYNSMPETMLTYRAATALIRRYCPEVMVGVPPANEVEDQNYVMRDVTPQDEGRADPRNVTPEIEPPKQEAKTKKTRKPVDRTPPPPAEPEQEPETGEVDDGDVTDIPSDYTGEGDPDDQTAQGDMLGGGTPQQDEVRDWGGLLNAILADVGRGAELSAAMGFYGPKVRELEEKNPELLDEFIEVTGHDLRAALNG